MERFGDTEIIKWIRELLPVIVLLIVLTSAIEAYFIKSNSDTVAALVAQNQALQAQQALTAQQFETFLKKFTAEANYECMIAADRAHLDNLPLPPSGTCTVAAP